VRIAISARAAAAPHVLPTAPAPDDAYDFLTYFECADADVPTFHAVCAALRDVTRNPEWRFVREGPTWHGAAWRAGRSCSYEGARLGSAAADNLATTTRN
jgi:hypothetical protein